jgi:hypothetical protein
VGFGRDISHCVPAANVGGVPVDTLALVGTHGIVSGVTTAQDASFFLAMLC